ncbi:RnfABCDGE type electron transport complex subunit B [Psychromonas sp. CNPT3]|uniref:electron transport complex subunit RsxB n=1 Tax=Psychromonas sp. CNPT3 TaxID=314282 RepID=UPI00006E5654|nr:electron transport complex subunit RsxB [Psychromonas sp. CNPT3]AGH81793.1 RnfABCDGE type electron transport complex subunit B [Psychromonas sp. CNPT3]
MLINIAIAIFTLGLLGAIFGVLLGYSSIRFKVKSDPIVEELDALLPQTQCGQCGYPGCKPYAQAIANGDAINKCPPGGEAVMIQLAQRMGLDPAALEGETKPKLLAFIREDECIGCTKCIQACPVDAILGATRQMHTVITDECTGCELCVAPCPTDCIDMLPISLNTHNWQWNLERIPTKTDTKHVYEKK